ncbi:MAG: Rne/Rng family ribonuclease [Gammaproteobacteria bacterium]|nr:Rne/Rng family ribonuclease [Gammaproteobacteria bacterium]
MKRMLINATQPEELRVAIVDGQHLHDLDIEVPSRAQKKANIYKGKITRIEPSLEAAFVDFGSERHGFLSFKEISRQYYKTTDSAESGRIGIKDVVSEGQELTVQVEKEERGNKGAALTTFISLAGRYLVLMPNNPRAGGISRRVEGDERADLKEALSTLDIPTGMGLIVRTAGVGRSAEELQWDLDYLLKVWTAIENASERPAPFLIYQESNLIVRAIRDYFAPDLNEVLIDDAEIFGKARDFVEQVMPQNLRKLKRYDDSVPLFSRYQIESRIESAFQHSVRLPSGGAIVIDHTEALVAIDINSARATKGSDIEETALNTNVEAADEIARQLRLRDLGGLIVIDFIDMTSSKNQREVENRLREALKQDRARVQVGRISRFGLLEMSRQRLRPSLGDSHLVVCSRCNGQGVIRSTESLSLSILRLVEEEAMKEKTGKVAVRLPLEVGTFLLNEKREAIVEIETRHGVGVVMAPDTAMETPHYELLRVRNDDTEHDVNSKSSYQLAETEKELPGYATQRSALAGPEPAVKRVAPPPPMQRTATAKSEPGFFKRIVASLFSTAAQVPASEPEKEQKNKTDIRNRDERRSSGKSRRRGPSGEQPRGRQEQQANQRQDNQKQEHSKPEQPGRDRRADGRADGRSDSNEQRVRRGGRARDERKQAVQNADEEDVMTVVSEGTGGDMPESEEDQSEHENTPRGRVRRGRRGGRGRSRRGRGQGAAAQSAAQAINGEATAGSNGPSQEHNPHVPSASRNGLVDAKPEDQNAHSHAKSAGENRRAAEASVPGGHGDSQASPSKAVATKDAASNDGQKQSASSSCGGHESVSSTAAKSTGEAMTDKSGNHRAVAATVEGSNKAGTDDTVKPIGATGGGQPAENSALLQAAKPATTSPPAPAAASEANITPAPSGVNKQDSTPKD